MGWIKDCEKEGKDHSSDNHSDVYLKITEQIEDLFEKEEETEDMFSV